MMRRLAFAVVYVLGGNEPWKVYAMRGLTITSLVTHMAARPFKTSAGQTLEVSLTRLGKDKSDEPRQTICLLSLACLSQMGDPSGAWKGYEVLQVSDIERKRHI